MVVVMVSMVERLRVKKGSEDGNYEGEKRGGSDRCNERVILRRALTRINDA